MNLIAITRHTPYDGKDVMPGEVYRLPFDLLWYAFPIQEQKRAVPLTAGIKTRQCPDCDSRFLIEDGDAVGLDEHVELAHSLVKDKAVAGVS